MPELSDEPLEERFLKLPASRTVKADEPAVPARTILDFTTQQATRIVGAPSRHHARR